MNSGRTRMVLSLDYLVCLVPKCWDASGLPVIVFNNIPKLTDSFPRVVTDEYGSLLAITRGFSLAHMISWAHLDVLVECMLTSLQRPHGHRVCPVALCRSDRGHSMDTQDLRR